MASPAPSRLSPLHPDDWVQAALLRLCDQGIDAVRVEVLARDLGVSKGSFYWHFSDRAALLEAVLTLWENGELQWLEVQGQGDGAAAVWARLISRTADPERIRTEVALVAWARKDHRVASRLASIEERRTRLIASVLRAIGFTQPAAESWSQIVWLLCVGWQERSTREPPLVGRSLEDLLSEVLLAASTPIASTD
jgi:AcrR family transcriptional regulator